MAKPIQYCKVKKIIINKEFNEKNNYNIQWNYM